MECLFWPFLDLASDPPPCMPSPALAASLTASSSLPSEAERCSAGGESPATSANSSSSKVGDASDVESVEIEVEREGRVVVVLLFGRE